MRELNQEAVLLAMCTKTFRERVIIFRFVLFPLDSFCLHKLIVVLEQLIYLVSSMCSFLIFSCSGTKQAAHRLKILFGLAGLKAAELHGNLTQVQRLDVSNLCAYMNSLVYGFFVLLVGEIFSYI